MIVVIYCGTFLPFFAALVFHLWLLSWIVNKNWKALTINFFFSHVILTVSGYRRGSLLYSPGLDSSMKWKLVTFSRSMYEKIDLGLIKDFQFSWLCFVRIFLLFFLLNIINFYGNSDESFNVKIAQLKKENKILLGAFRSFNKITLKIETLFMITNKNFKN